MRPSRISRFMKWRDAQPRYQTLLRELLALSEQAERASSEAEREDIEARWKEAKEWLLALEKVLIAEWEERYG